MYTMPEVIIPKPLAFNWDLHNKEKNWLKHNVDYKECEEVFTDPNISNYPDLTHSQQEKRYLTLGQTQNGRKLTIIFTLRSQQIRVISARNMSAKERNQYEPDKK